MAKKRKTSRTRKASRPKASAQRKPARRSKGGETDPMHIIAGLLAAGLIAVGIYFYQASQKAGGAPMSANPPAVAMEKK
jgi:hypothetical protein